MQLDFSPLTVYNSVTGFISADSGESILKRMTENKIGIRRQFATRGQIISPQTVEKKIKRTEKKIGYADNFVTLDKIIVR